MAKKRARKAMKKDNFYTSAGVVFAFAGAFHLFRLIYGWELAIDGWVIPKFISIILVAVTLYLALEAFKHNK